MFLIPKAHKEVMSDHKKKTQTDKQTLSFSRPMPVLLLSTPTCEISSGLYVLNENFMVV